MRKCRDWIKAFLRYTEAYPTPDLMREWAAVGCLAGALERRVFTATPISDFFPNFFIVLVGPPATGKSVIIDKVRDLWLSVQKLHVAPSSMTQRGLIDFLKEKITTVTISPTRITTYQCGLFASTEFGNLVPEYDLKWLNTLNELFDCGRYYEDQTKMHGKVRIEGPCINILAGTQSKYLASLLPDAAFGMGFTSRLVMVYSPVGKKTSFFHAPKPNAQLFADLVHDLQQITALAGEIRWDDDVIEDLESWRSAGEPPVPDHPKLQHYNGRRFTMLIKLCMVVSVASSSDLVVTKAHSDRAKQLLLSTEKLMPLIFTEMSSRGHDEVQEEAYNFLWAQWLRSGRKPIPEEQLTFFLRSRVAPHMLGYTIDALIRTGVVRVEQRLNLPGEFRAFVPVPRHEHGLQP